jgi:hypothetical protein
MFSIQKCDFFLMCKAAQGFSSRRTKGYAADGNPRRTQRIGKGAIFERET